MFASNLKFIKIGAPTGIRQKMELKKYNNRHYNWVIHLFKDFCKEIGGLVVYH